MRFVFHFIDSVTIFSKWFLIMTLPVPHAHAANCKTDNKFVNTIWYIFLRQFTWKK